MEGIKKSLSFSLNLDAQLLSCLRICIRLELGFANRTKPFSFEYSQQTNTKHKQKPQRRGEGMGYPSVDEFMDNPSNNLFGFSS